MNIQDYETSTSKPKKRRGLPPLFATVAGAIIGSAATLYITPVIGLGEIISSSDYTSGKPPAVEERVSSANTVTAVQTAAGSGSMVSAIEKVTKAVVGVVNIQQQPDLYTPGSLDQGAGRESGTGSGVIFKKSGSIAYVVTNNHVIEGAGKVEVSLTTGERISAELVGADPLTDLAVLKIDGKYAETVAEFGDSSSLRIGEQVAAIGNPLGLDLSSTVTQGIVSGMKRTIPVSTSLGEWDLNVIQTDAAINPGNSGGALINSDGQVVGINSLKIAEDGIEGLGFAIPSEDVLPIVEDLMRYGEVKRPYMGVGLQSLGDIPAAYQQQLNIPEETQGGVVVTSVEPSSPAGEAGIQVKDVITAVNKTKVETIGELRKYIYTEAKIGDEVSLELYRDGKKLNVTLKMSERNM